MWAVKFQSTEKRWNKWCLNPLEYIFFNRTSLTWMYWKPVFYVKWNIVILKLYSVGQWGKNVIKKEVKAELVKLRVIRIPMTRPLSEFFLDWVYWLSSVEGVGIVWCIFPLCWRILFFHLHCLVISFVSVSVPLAPSLHLPHSPLHSIYLKLKSVRHRHWGYGIR